MKKLIKTISIIGLLSCVEIKCSSRFSKNTKPFSRDTNQLLEWVVLASIDATSPTKLSEISNEFKANLGIQDCQTNFGIPTKINKCTFFLYQKAMETFSSDNRPIEAMKYPATEQYLLKKRTDLDKINPKFHKNICNTLIDCGQLLLKHQLNSTFFPEDKKILEYIINLQLENDEIDKIKCLLETVHNRVS